MKRAEAGRARPLSWVFAGMWLALASTPGGVRAHAGPQVRDIFVHPDQTKKLLLSNRGLIFGDGSNWQLMCNEALGVSTSELPNIAQLPDGRLLAASSAGLSASSDGGCNWVGVAPYATLNVPGMAQDPGQPNRLYLATFGNGSSGLQKSEDGGQTWQPLMPVSDMVYLRYVLIAPSKPDQIYVRSLDFTTPPFVYKVWSSGDAGKTWAGSNPVDISASETDFWLLGVSPSDPQLLVGKAEAADPIQDPERLLVSHDGGKTFDSPISFHVISAVTWSADGSTLWIGSDDGLFRSTDNGKTFAQIGGAAYVSCLRVEEGQLLVGGYWRGIMAGMPGIGVSTDGGATLDQWMGLSQVLQPLQCDPSSMTAVTCATLWPDWEREILGIYDTGAGGAGGAGGASAAAGSGGTAGAAAPAAGSGGAGGASAGSVGGGAAPAASKPASSGCSVGGAGSDVSAAWLAALALGMVGRRRLRRRAASSAS
jgi:MYXO-CTERM domain-containing protein